jgi:hypothetical protein
MARSASLWLLTRVVTALSKLATMLKARMQDTYMPDTYMYVNILNTPIANRHRHTGLAMGLIYWHFVDIVWIFPFVNVYVSNTFND